MIFMNTEKLKDKNIIASLSVLAVSVIATVVGFFLLPDKIYVQLFSEIKMPETDALIFLVAATLVVGLACLMCVFTENKKKWLATEVVLAILHFGCIVYNYIVL